MIVIIRGLPGAGHRKLATAIGRIAKNSKIFSADDYMVGENGEYRYDVTRLEECHNRCLEETFAHKGISIVCNTFARAWEIARYADNGRKFVVLDLADQGMSNEELHERTPNRVPIEKIAKMRDKYQFFDGNENVIRVPISVMENLKED